MGSGDQMARSWVQEALVLSDPSGAFGSLSQIESEAGPPVVSDKRVVVEFSGRRSWAVGSRRVFGGDTRARYLRSP